MILGGTTAVILLVAAAMITPIVLPAPVAAPSTHSLVPISVWGPRDTHLQHIITVVLENHVYDNLFGGYCRSLGAYCSSVGNGPPVGSCIPIDPLNLSAGCVPPYYFNVTQFTTPDMQHDWISAPAAYDGGTNLGFYAAEHAGSYPFGEYDATTIPIYWQMAEEYALGDNFFAANLSYSLPNHWDLLAGQTPPIAQDSYVKYPSDRVTYLNQANATPTIQDLVTNATNVSWKYYDFSLLPYAKAIQAPGWNTAYDYWNPLAGRAESYTTANASHFVDRGTFLTDLQNGSLPNLSWVIPAANASNHPGYNLSIGESWVAQLVDAVENSSYWSSTAIFVLWDDYGGWYDHVVPPIDQSDGLSFRVPILVISPYTKENYISHEFLDFFSILHFEEWMFGLGCLTRYDCSAPLPFDFFEFNGTARPSMMFATQWNQTSYPIPLQAPGAGPTLCPRCGQVDWPTWNGANLPAGDPRYGD